MAAYPWVKLLHILAAIVAVGTNITYFWWLRRVQREPAHNAFVLDSLRSLDARLANPAYVVLPITGVVMVLIGDLGFTRGWIAGAIVLYILMGAFAGIFFSPSLRRQLDLAVSGDSGSPAYAAAARQTTTTGIITMLLIGAILVLMVVKPG